jgi:hypothetical protein
LRLLFIQLLLKVEITYKQVFLLFWLSKVLYLEQRQDHRINVLP